MAATVEGKLEFQIKEATLGKALTSLARQTQAQLLYPYEHAHSHDVNPVIGRFTLAEALELMLKGTAFSGELSEQGVITVTLLKENNQNIQGEHMTEQNHKRTLLSTLVTLFVGSLSSAAIHAEDGAVAQGIEEVVVTARRRAEQIQDVPIAVTAFGTEAIEQLGIKSTDDIRLHVPGVQISPSPFGNASPGFTIRGQRQQENLITQDPSIGVYFADIVQGRAHGTVQSLYDLESIQVLKGPQGTLFGRNTTGGAILLTPAKPDFDSTYGSISLNMGNYDYRSTTGVFNLALSDKVALRFAGQIDRRDGYTDNLFTGPAASPTAGSAGGSFKLEDKLDDQHSDSYRVSLTLRPTENIESTFLGYKVNVKENGPGTALIEANPAFTALTDELAAKNSVDFHDVYNDNFNGLNLDVSGISNTTTWDIGGITLKNILGYRQVRSEVAVDLEGSAALFNGNGWFNTVNLLDAHQWSNEFQVLGTSFDNKLDWIVGAYWFEEQGRDTQDSALFGQRINDGAGKNTSYSLFNQNTYHFETIEGLSLTAGVRYTWDERDVDHKGQLYSATDDAFFCRVKDEVTGLPLDPCSRKASVDFEDPSWTVGLDYKINADTMVYLTHRRGLRSGGWGLRNYGPAAGLFPFNAETVDDFELGLKADFALGNMPARLNAAIFTSDYKDIQRTVTYIPAPGAPVTTDVINAATATIEGYEVELTILPLDNLQITAFYGDIEASYDDFINNGKDLSDADFLGAPRFTGGINLSYTLPLDESIGEITFASSYYSQSSQALTDVGEGSLVSGYELVQYSLDWQSVLGSTFDAKLWVKNAADEEYITGGLNAYGSVGNSTGFLGAPRTYGLDVTYRF